MKKLLDESPDDLTRALLDAGRAHRPPAANQAKLLVALGVGAGVGLFSSNALAWLGTSTGKLTVLGVGLSIAGAVYVALPEQAGSPSQGVVARVESRSSLAAAAPASAAVALASSPGVSSPGVSSPPVSTPALASPVAAAPASPSSVPALVADAPPLPRSNSVSSSRVARAAPARREHAPAASEALRRVSRDRESTAARRDDVEEPLERLAEGPLPAAPAASPAVGAPPAAAARLLGLESEIQLVDAMRSAARRNDAPELRRLVDSYRGTFPEGQLRQEVSELALRSLPKPSP